jgi:hypothetical protein
MFYVVFCLEILILVVVNTINEEKQQQQRNWNIFLFLLLLPKKYNRVSNSKGCQVGAIFLF